MPATVRSTSIIILLVLSLAPATLAQEDLEFETILVPVHMSRPIPGALGTEWLTRLTAYIAAEGHFVISHGRPECRGPACPGPLKGLEGPGTYSIHTSADVGMPGMLLYIRRGTRDQVWFNLAIEERDSGRLPTSIPLVYEEDLFSAPFMMPGISVAPTSRLMLRVYDVRRGPEDEATIRIWSEQTGELIGELRTFLILPVPWEQPHFPRYDQIDLLSEVPGIATEESIRVEVIPDGDEGRFWAFVSVTDNVTNEFFVVTPR